MACTRWRWSSGWTFQDLTACAPRTRDWRRAGAAVPLLLSREEFLRTLDVFPVEYGGIIANHQLIAGENMLAGLQVSEADLRRGCELQVKSHLIHLREGYVETGGGPPLGRPADRGVGAGACRRSSPTSGSSTAARPRGPD